MVETASAMGTQVMFGILIVIFCINGILSWVCEDTKPLRTLCFNLFFLVAGILMLVGMHNYLPQLGEETPAHIRQVEHLNEGRLQEEAMLIADGRTGLPGNEDGRQAGMEQI